ncbi:peptidoglycan-binding protein [Streptomyces sp. B93]|uniref:peptidoglycan-binding protein n=1 Tax=Streptomyces sp. B93 TaxID=2824875 RepID=UPI001B37C714|nr:peptidoglycan-binding protein [Streptomyces sp. B93]MBQ1092246.1 peptidoglycan-binding protein [Streptomyces sp. B93]
MASWRPLPDGLSPHAHRLVTRMRQLKDRTGLSLSALERRTSYSRSSWERYLNGKMPPPSEAVAELAALAGEDGRALGQLQTLAAGDWQRSASPGAVPSAPSASEGADEPDGAAPRRRASQLGAWARLRAPYLISGLILAGTAAGVAATWDRAGDVAAGGGFTFRAGVSYDCPVTRNGAWLTAGYSDTRRAYLHQVLTSWDVVEAQCLLEYHGYSVAEVDGAYDAMTERAVKRFQEDHGGLVVDGVIGEHTWEVLRR